ncbi:PepSY domain-containing protein [Lentibacillus sediminis]|uniref:PepSY domain-containing protein n=1 Tax=Lentibacillus sediminis TaxID=1940529 RepID=UPI000C1BA818|nr:PepSY domain-containing protein [Lentibacillus sediminis]
MIKKVILPLAAVVVAVVLGLAIFQSNAFTSSPELSAEEVKGLLEAQYGGAVPDIAFLEKTGTYQAELEREGVRYHVTVDGENGEVLNLQTSGETPETSSETGDQQEEPAENAKEESGSTENQGNEEEQSKDNQQTSNDGTLSKEEAKAIAQEEFSGTVEELELDGDDGRLIYEIEMVNGEDEAQIELDAFTGEVIVLEIDREDED